MGNLRMCTCNRLQQGDHLRQRAKAIHCLERRQRIDQLRLVVRIFIVALGSRQRNSRCILTGKAHFGRTFAGMDLNRQRLIGTQHFEQERQFTKALCYRIAQHRGGCRINHVT